MQTCLSPHFGVISERVRAADETLPFIDSGFTRRQIGCKAFSGGVDDAVDALRYLVATRARTVTQRKLRGL
jgi:hypothetical protein